jgi:hypothetical protein
MQDSEGRYLSRREQRSNGHQRLPQDEETEQEQQQQPSQELSLPRTSERLEQGEKLVSQPRPALPRAGLQYALIAGLIAGILSVLQSLAITLLNTGAFQQASKEIAASGKENVNTALALTGIACLTLLISLLICGVAGYVVGKVAVQRRLGFLAGALAGAIIYGGTFTVRYIPNYPGNTAASITGGGGAIAGGILLSLVFLLIWALIGGLMSLLGAWIATRQHPFYSR